MPLGLGMISVCRTQKSASWSLPFRIAWEPDLEIKPLDQLLIRLKIQSALPQLESGRLIEQTGGIDAHGLPPLTPFHNRSMNRSTWRSAAADVGD
jgi:hypothetical protein